MQPPHTDGNHPPPSDPLGSGCSHCSGCEEPRSLEENQSTVSGGSRWLLVPVGLFLFPVVLAILGAILGGITAIGELLGGLLGLAAGMAMSVFAARGIGLTDSEENN